MRCLGYSTQYTELTANTRRGARGLLVPPKMGIPSPQTDTLPSESVAEIIGLDLKPVEAVFDCGFTTKATLATMAGLDARVCIVCSPQNDGSRRTPTSGLAPGQI